MGRGREDRISELAAAQHGVITRRQLLEKGVSTGKLRGLLESGRLRPVHRGVYFVGPVAGSRAREMAAALAVGPSAAVSHTSAAALLGIVCGSGRDPAARHHVPPGTAASPVHVSFPGGGRRQRLGIRVHLVTSLEPDERRVVEGVPITAPGRTLVDVAGMLCVRQLEQALARAEREGLIRPEELRSLPERYRGRPGIAALRSVLDLQGGAALTRSEAEAAFLALVREARLPPVAANVAMGPYELDCFWSRARIAVEIDGFAHHSTRPRFEADRRRDAYLMARGIKVIHLTWRMIKHERLATAVLLGQALARAERT